MSWLKNYREKECKTWMGKFFQRLVFTWMYKIYTAAVLVLISSIGFGLVSEGGFGENFFSFLYSIGLGFFVVLAVVSIAYAWVINPIKSLMEKRKNKKGA